MSARAENALRLFLEMVHSSEREMESSMQALVRGHDGAELRRVPLPVPREGEVLVRVSLAGICRTDLFAAEGALPIEMGRVLGHELAGTIGERRVAIVPALACGRCDAGCGLRPERCARADFLGVDVDGGFAQFVRVSRECVLEVGEMQLRDREIAFVEPLAAAMAVLPHLHDRKRVLVIGRGRIATLVARVIETRGAAPDIAFEDDVPNDAYDAVIETIPTATALDRALHALRPGGRLILKSRPAQRVPLDTTLAVRREIEIVGARYGSFTEAIGWLVEKRVDVSDLLGPTYDIARFAEAFAHARREDAPKIFLDPSGGR